MLPGIGPSDPRIAVDPDVAPWSAVARLQIPGVSRCTAVMVAPRLAATALHCLVSRALGRVVPAASIHLLFGYGAGGFTRHEIAVGVILPAQADERARTPRGDDVAFVQLPDPVGAVLRPSSAPAPIGASLRLGGYAQDRAERLTVDPDCPARGYARDADGQALLLHGCSGTRGTSGGPVLMRDGAGGWRLVGLEIAGDDGAAGGVAVPGFTIARLLAVAEDARGRQRTPAGQALPP